MRAQRRHAGEQRIGEIDGAPGANSVGSDRSRCWADRTSRTAFSVRARRRASSGSSGPAWRGRNRSRRVKKTSRPAAASPGLPTSAPFAVTSRGAEAPTPRAADEGDAPQRRNATTQPSGRVRPLGASPPGLSSSFGAVESRGSRRNSCSTPGMFALKLRLPIDARAAATSSAEFLESRVEIRLVRPRSPAAPSWRRRSCCRRETAPALSAAASTIVLQRLLDGREIERPAFQHPTTALVASRSPSSARGAARSHRYPPDAAPMPQAVKTTNATMRFIDPSPFEPTVNNRRDAVQLFDDRAVARSHSPDVTPPLASADGRIDREGRRRHVDVVDAVFAPQRVDDGVHHRRRRADRPGLARALQAERIGGRGDVAGLEIESRRDCRRAACNSP